MDKTTYTLRRMRDGRWEYINENCDGFVLDPLQSATFGRIGDAMKASVDLRERMGVLVKVFAIERG